MNTHTRYQLLIGNRYGYLQDTDFGHRSDYLLALHAPYYFQNESTMLSYLDAHPNSDLKSICSYLCHITAEKLSLSDEECAGPTIHAAYLDLIQKRYSQLKHIDYRHYGHYIWLIRAPEHYLSEKAVFFYAKMYPSATMKELLYFFNLITPDGLAPDDDGEDL